MEASKAKILALNSLKDFMDARVAEHIGSPKGTILIMSLAKHDFKCSYKNPRHIQARALELVKEWALTYWDVPYKSSRYRKWVVFLEYRPKEDIYFS